jgi:hypothetical protein
MLGDTYTQTKSPRTYTAKSEVFSIEDMLIVKKGGGSRLQTTMITEKPPSWGAQRYNYETGTGKFGKLEWWNGFEWVEVTKSPLQQTILKLDRAGVPPSDVYVPSERLTALETQSGLLQTTLKVKRIGLELPTTEIRKVPLQLDQITVQIPRTKLLFIPPPPPSPTTLSTKRWKPIPPPSPDKTPPPIKKVWTPITPLIPPPSPPPPKKGWTPTPPPYVPPVTPKPGGGMILPPFAFGPGGIGEPGRPIKNIKWKRTNLVAATNPDRVFPGRPGSTKPFAPMKKQNLVKTIFSTTQKVAMRGGVKISSKAGIQITTPKKVTSILTKKPMPFTKGAKRLDKKFKRTVKKVKKAATTKRGWLF